MVRRASRSDAPQMPGQALYHKPFAPRREWAGRTEYGTTTSRAIRASIKDFANKRPNKAWAPRILARHATGEEIEMRVLELARAVVNAPAEREPGSDDE